MTPPTRIEQKRATRAAIERAARERFDEVGFDATTIRDIAGRAGVSVGSVHGHFKDKRALLFACFYADIDAAISRAWATLDGEASLVSQLVHLARVLFESYCARPDLSRVMFKESLFLEPADDEHGGMEPFLAGVADLFRAAHERGEIDRLPGEGHLEAQLFFSVYCTVLIGGLGGHFGEVTEPKRSASIWAERVRALMQVALATGG